MFLAIKKHSIFYARITIILISSLLLTCSINYKADAITGSEWKANSIISDSLFYDNTTMSVNDIQYFLNTKVPTCDTQGTQSAADVGYPKLTHAQYATQIAGWSGPPYVCLKDYMQVPDSSQIISNFQGSTPKGSISAAAIIKNTADTYNISPKALLVTLQKESLNLIYDSWPMLSQYKSAMGYGCPDTAPCDAQYAGFYNQINNAAYQFNLYRNNATAYRYKPFQTNNIYYNPNFSCGSTSVNIQTYATAGLYNYTPYQPNQSTLDNLYGTGDSCGAYGNRNFWRTYNDWFGSTQTNEIFINYKSHVSSLGWTGTTVNGGATGTTGQSKSMEAFKINGLVEYSSYNNVTGWQPTVNGGMTSGTTGMSRPIQAIKINPISTLADRYDIYYRVHVSTVGWMGWTKNGQISGVTGDNTKNIESIEIQLVAKGFGIIGSTDNAYQNIDTTTYSPTVSLNITSHVGSVGWQPTVTDTMVSGTTEQTKRIEAVKIALTNNSDKTGDIIYAGYLSDIGWQDFKSNDEIAGTTGQSRRMEAIRIALTGELSDNYDIWYRGHVQNIGWLGWVKNGDVAGSMGASRQLEAIETRIVAKGSSALKVSTSLYNPLNLSVPESYSLNYSTHLSNIGWVGGVKQNEIGGTTGQSRPIEALKFDNFNSIFGNISINCSVYVTDTGWLNNITPGNTCGTTGQSKPIEAVKLNLTGETSTLYDIYYKVHISHIGWQDWVKNDKQTGTPLSNNAIEAIVIKLVQK